MIPCPSSALPLRGIDRCSISFQYAQTRAVAHAEAHTEAADIVEDILEVGSDLRLLRLPLEECVEWFTAALNAAQRLNRRHAMYVHHGNLGNV